MKYTLNTETIYDDNSIFQSPRFVADLFFGGKVICPHCQTGNREGGKYGYCYLCGKSLDKPVK